METRFQSLHKELRERLLRAGVAPRHVRRYLAELQDHYMDLVSEEDCSDRSPAYIEASAIARLGSIDELASAMTARREFLSWSALAPWLAFCCAPLCMLAAAYFAACVYLWCGWQLFLPHAETPFGAPFPGSIFSAANVYFQAGKAYYFLAPALVGWACILIALRQRITGVWPVVASVLLAWMGATSRIEASRSAVPQGLGHIRMGFFSFGPTHEFILGQLLYGLVLFSLISVPFLLGRWRLPPARC